VYGLNGAVQTARNASTGYVYNSQFLLNVDL